MNNTNFIAVHRDTDKQKRDYWRRVQNQRDRFETRFHAYLRRVLVGQFKELSNSITSTNLNEEIVQIITREPMKQAFELLYKTVGGYFANESYVGMKHSIEGIYTKASDKTIDEWYSRMMYYVNNKAGLRITSITAETRRQALEIIRQVLGQSTEQGWGADETATAMRKALEDKSVLLAQWRALRIARTEIVTASNIGALIGAKELDYPMEKYWIATYDSRTRDTHLIVEEQNPKRMDEGFRVGAYLMETPGDPDAGPEETINCRCTIAFKVKSL